MSDAELVNAGAADGLPALGDTTRRRVQRALAFAKTTYPNAAARVGPGVGVTYSIKRGSAISYHRGPDYQVWVRFKSLQACPSMAGFTTDGDGRIPVFAVLLL
jgi:hypothetical protein